MKSFAVKGNAPICIYCGSVTYNVVPVAFIVGSLTDNVGPASNIVANNVGRNLT